MARFHVGVLLADPNLPYSFSDTGALGEEEFRAFGQLRGALEEIESSGDFSFEYFDNHESLIDDLRSGPCDLILNFCDTGYRNNWALVTHIPSLLEILNVPFTGSNGFALDLTSDKSLVRTLALNLEIPVPREFFVDLGSEGVILPELYPAIIKPNVGAGSFGMTKNCVVHNDDQAKAYMHWLMGKIDTPEALVQEFLTGPEYTLGLIGNPNTHIIPLPVAEIDYSDLPSDLPPVFTYEAKFDPLSPYWQTLRHRRADLKEATYVQMVEDSKRLYRRLGIRDYARFDFRLGNDGIPRLLDINPNPTWYADSRMAMMSEWAGYSYPDMLRLILEAALKRNVLI